jgi:hypothetical protein
VSTVIKQYTLHKGLDLRERLSLKTSHRLRKAITLSACKDHPRAVWPVIREAQDQFTIPNGASFEKVSGAD